MNGVAKKLLLREEKGFALPEMLVTLIIMTVVLFALYNIFDMSTRVFSFGNDKVEAVENARLGLEKMAREIRAAYPVNQTGASSCTKDNRVITSTISNPSNQITFGNDLNGNWTAHPTCPTRNDTGEQITYRLSGNTLLRNDEPTVEFVKASGLAFRYLNKNGAETTTESEVAIVRITLQIEIDRKSLGTRTQTLTTDVALRNRGT